MKSTIAPSLSLPFQMLTNIEPEASKVLQILISQHVFATPQLTKHTKAPLIYFLGNIINDVELMYISHLVQRKHFTIIIPMCVYPGIIFEVTGQLGIQRSRLLFMLKYVTAFSTEQFFIIWIFVSVSGNLGITGMTAPLPSHGTPYIVKISAGDRSTITVSFIMRHSLSGRFSFCVSFLFLPFST